jgi:hypothetical protein
MNLFSIWRKGERVIHNQGNTGKDNNKSILRENKQGLFDDIFGFEDVKSLIE